MSSCWRMTNSQYYEAGVGPGITWKILGTCYVTLDAKRSVTRIEVIKPKQVLTESQGMAYTKPYQNPTGVWMIGIWESPAKRSAIFATKTW